MDKQRLRFTLHDDVTLLKEVLCENPFENIGKWNGIQEKVNEATSKLFSVRCLKEHLQHLMATFKKQDNINKKKSGTEEEYSDLKVLLQNVCDLSNEFGTTTKLKKKRCTEINPGITARNEGVILSKVNANNDFNVDTCIFEYVLPDDEEIIPSANSTLIADETGVAENPMNLNFRPTLLLPNQRTDAGVAHKNAPLLPNSTRKRNPMMDYLREKQQIEQAMKKEEISIQSKRLRLEEKTLDFEKEKLQFEKEKLEFEKAKFELDSKETEARLKIEMDERRERLQGEREQRKMLFEIFKSRVLKE